MFEIILLVFAAIGHTILWVALVNRAHGLGVKRRWVTLLTLACIITFALMPLVILTAFLTVVRQPDPPARITLFYAAAYTYILACAVVCVVAAIQRLHWRGHAERKGILTTNHTTRIHLPSQVMEPLMSRSAAWLGRLPGNEVLSLYVQEKQLGMPRLAEKDARLRVAHLSDLHMSGRMTRPFYEYVVDETNRRQPDIVAITGDLVDHDECLPWISEVLGRLRAPGGVYYVLGNHDLRVTQSKLRDALAAATTLTHIGEHGHRIKLGNLDIILGGNERPWMGVPTDFTQLPEHDAAGLPLRIVLSHSPDHLAWAAENAIDLVLAGHVHGGQVCLPVLGPFTAPSMHGVRYAAGIFRCGNTVMHVSRGTASLTPLRWNCPPEIAILTLQAARTS